MSKIPGDNKIKSIFVLLIVSVLLFVSSPTVDATVYPTKTIYFSNLSEDNATQYCPGSPSGMRFPVTGIIVSGIVYIKTSDLKIGLGVSYYSQNLGNTIKFTIHGNGSPQVFSYNNINTYGIYRNYSVANRVSITYVNTYRMTNGTVTQSTNHSFSYESSNGAPFIFYNGYYYVPAKLTALSLGALVYNEKSSYDTIFDYRVDNTIYSGYDQNEYLVGGKWMTNWSNEGNDYLAPHFKINEIWSKNTPDSYYLNQMKISVKQLSAAELVRHYYRNDQSLGIDPGFRGWCQNFNNPNNPALLSWHTRGRAWDSDELPISVKDAVWNDMCVTDSGIKLSTPYLVSGSIYRTRKTSMKEITLASEVEGGVNWLHLQTDPRNNQTSHLLLP